MATLDSTRRPALEATSDALDRAIEAAVSGRPEHSSGTTFVPSDVDAAAASRPYVVVHPDGTEDSHPDRRWVWVLIAAAAAAILLARPAQKHKSPVT